ncbi:hypothetical protein FZEAL_9677 [Fusarium zealandicum]|uniref:Uncharacterized protein n=1 Tax=Fusarium zealandicum TaxID=1053134 RepID=A0A8H4U9V8_9HYPO|nr:hypothetical protein FZEAL_9677 [Fusarium zealandicum]
MPSFANLITSLACLVAATTAIPTSIVARQHHTDCTVAGEYYYACGPHKGCFAKDPCSSTATPTTKPIAHAPQGECPTGTGIATHLPSALYDIFPEHPALSREPVSAVHMESYDNTSQVEQVIVFSGIPADAKYCGFGWKQGERIERVFLIDGVDALVEIKQLSGFPAEGTTVTYDSIKPFDDSETTSGADFTNWDDITPATHGSGTFDCAETMYFKTALKHKDGNTKLYLGQDENNGYHLTYTC